MEKFSKNPLERFKVVVILWKPTPKVLLEADNVIDAFIPWLIRGETRKSITAQVFDENGMLAATFKKHDSLDLLVLDEICDRTESFDELFTRG